MIGSLSITPLSGLPELRMQPSIGSSGPKPAQSPDDFTSILKGVATGAAATLRSGEGAAILGVQGNLPLQSVIEQVMAAERTLQAGIAIRDKLVSSYLEITRMQI